jgi:hypothetical protein
VNSRNQSYFVYFLLIVAIGALIYMGYHQGTTTEKPLTINEVAQAVQKGEVARIIIESDDQFRVVYKASYLAKNQTPHWWINYLALASCPDNFPLAVV